jgi:hypothetical protein
MSTYAVFGMTEHFAREEAKKKTPTWKGGRELTLEEWLEAVEARVARTMAGKRIVQLSSMFDAPQFADQFIRLLQADDCERRDICVRARVRVSSDEKKKTKKAYQLKWQAVA